MVRNFFIALARNFIDIFSGKNALWHFFACAMTAGLVLSGFDWWYFTQTRGISLLVAWPAVALGGLLPIFVPLILLMIGRVKKNRKITGYGLALAQAALLGSAVSSLYKTVTGRLQPDLTNIAHDISHEFHFGFLHHGIFWGWPSSHTTIAFAMAMTLIILFPKNRLLTSSVLLYALYVGLAVSISIHWFSDFIAGAVIGSVIGVVVGRSAKQYFYE